MLYDMPESIYNAMCDMLGFDDPNIIDDFLAENYSMYTNRFDKPFSIFEFDARDENKLLEFLLRFG